MDGVQFIAAARRAASGRSMILVMEPAAIAI